jgi:cbb3-type cytochrome oxidase maturation protein
MRSDGGSGTSRPITLGAIGLAGFLWSLKNGQYDDLDGAAWRAIADDDPAGSSNE